MDSPIGTQQNNSTRKTPPEVAPRRVSPPIRAAVGQHMNPQLLPTNKPITFSPKIPPKNQRSDQQNPQKHPNMELKSEVQKISLVPPSHKHGNNIGKVSPKKPPKNILKPNGKSPTNGNPKVLNRFNGTENTGGKMDADSGLKSDTKHQKVATPLALLGGSPKLSPKPAVNNSNNNLTVSNNRLAPPLGKGQEGEGASPRSRSPQPPKLPTKPGQHSNDDGSVVKSKQQATRGGGLLADRIAQFNKT